MMVRSSLILSLKKNLTLLRFSLPSSYFTSLANPKPHPPQFLVKDYLIGSCGFSPYKAATASKHLRFASPAKPDSVKHFLKHKAGFTDHQVSSIVSRNFRILDANVEETMAPNLEAFNRLSYLSDSQRRQLIISNPCILTMPRAISRFEFWKDFLNGDMEKLLPAVEKNSNLLCFDVDSGDFAQKVALLQEYRFSQADIVTIAVKFSGLFSKTTVSIEELLNDVWEIGIPRGSPFFTAAFSVLCTRAPKLLQSKMELFEECGMSEPYFIVAFMRAPKIVSLSDEQIREKMKFLVGTAFVDPIYISSHPGLLMLSLEKRLIPRYHVMRIFKSTCVLNKKTPSLFSHSNKRFVKNYIHPYKEKVPEIAKFAPEGVRASGY